jgi:hypothetical protein
MIIVKCYARLNCQLGSAGGFSGKKKETLYYSLLITRRQELPSEAKGKSAVYQNQK